MTAGPIRSAIVLAAGRGERMRPLTDQVPKPLLEVAGRSLIDHQLLRLAEAGVEQVVINLAWKGELIREALGDHAHGMSIVYSDEPEGALESGGGIVQAIGHLEAESFLVVNADVFCDFDLRTLALAAGDLATLVLVPNPEHRPEGDFGLADGRVLREGGDRLTFSGIAAYRQALFRDRPPGRYPLAPILHEAVDAGRVAGVRHDGIWWDVGTPDRLEALRRAVQPR